jgi:transcriptional regulator with XRE-family HTH domain
MTENSQIDLIYESVGKRIQELRTAKRITQAMVAEEARLTRQSVANIEHGRQRFLLHTLIDIARALGIPPADLLPPPAQEVDVPMNLDGFKLTPAARRLVQAVLNNPAQT